MKYTDNLELGKFKPMLCALPTRLIEEENHNYSTGEPELILSITSKNEFRTRMEVK